MYTIFVVSDGTGRTARQALNAALTQFPNITVDIIKFSEVRTKEQVLNVVEEAVKANASIAHTLVKNNVTAGSKAFVSDGKPPYPDFDSTKIEQFFKE